MQWMQDDVAFQPLVDDINVMFESDLDVSAHQLYVDSLRTAAPMLMKDLAPLVFIDRRARRYLHYPLFLFCSVLVLALVSSPVQSTLSHSCQAI